MAIFHIAVLNLRMDKKSLQDTFAANSTCYGCGPANENGFHIKSFVVDDKIIAHFTPQPNHNACPNVLNGGVIGTLLDCHCNWAAAWFLMKAQGLAETPCTVTAEYKVKLLRPTPMDTELRIEASLLKIEGSRAVIYGELIANEKVCDTCEGTFIAVQEGHPAFHRW